jgi:hypothetical protein
MTLIPQRYIPQFAATVSRQWNFRLTNLIVSSPAKAKSRAIKWKIFGHRAFNNLHIVHIREYSLQYPNHLEHHERYIAGWL